jgi:hypothetical protein
MGCIGHVIGAYVIVRFNSDRGERRRGWGQCRSVTTGHGLDVVKIRESCRPTNWRIMEVAVSCSVDLDNECREEDMKS